MKNRDIIRRFEQSLYIYFGASGNRGNICLLRMAGLSLQQSGTTITARYDDCMTQEVLVEDFANEKMASSAFAQLQHSVIRYVTQRRFVSVVKAVVKWILGPFLLVMLVMMLNLLTTRAGSGVAPSVLSGISPPLVAIPGTAGTPVPPGAPAPAPVASARELSRAMSDGVKSGKFSVQLSKGSKGTLYVFSDPSCPHCQDLEPELKALASDYTIEIFPVSVIGGAVSAQRVSRLLCTRPEKRIEAWRSAVDGNDPASAVCDAGSAAVAANNQFFHVMRFVGTPTLINQAGEQLPDSVPLNAAGIRQWMSTAATGRN